MKTPLETYQEFRASMLAKSDDWQNLLAENVLLEGPLARVEGKAAFIEVNGPFFASIISSDIIGHVSSGDFVITRIQTVVQTPAGAPLPLNVSEWYEIKDGKLQSLIVYFDTAAFRKAFGME